MKNSLHGAVRSLRSSLPGLLYLPQTSTNFISAKTSISRGTGSVFSTHWQSLFSTSAPTSDPKQADLIDTYFDLAFGSTKKSTLKKETSALAEQIRLHDRDVGGSAVQAVSNALRLRRLDEHLEQNRQDKANKHARNLLFQKQRRVLKHLRRTDPDRYAHVCSLVAIQDEQNQDAVFKQYDKRYNMEKDLKPSDRNKALRFIAEVTNKIQHQTIHNKTKRPSHDDHHPPADHHLSALLSSSEASVVRDVRSALGHVSGKLEGPDRPDTSSIFPRPSKENRAARLLVRGMTRDHPLTIALEEQGLLPPVEKRRMMPHDPRSRNRWWAIFGRKKFIKVRERNIKRVRHGGQRRVLK